MNTYRIYEDFKATLGEAAAKSLAQTLGAMFEELKDTVTKEDFRILRESIDANVSRLDGAMTRLAEGQGKLFEAQTHTDAGMSELAEGQARLFESQTRADAKMAALIEGQTKLFEAQTHTDAKMAELAEGQARLFESQTRTDAKMSELAEGQTKLFEAQTRTDAKMSELAEGQTKLFEAQTRTDAKMSELAEGQTKLFEAQTRTDAKMSELAEGQTKLFEAQTRTDAKMSELAEGQARTDTKISKLADGQERLFEAQTHTEQQIKTLAELMQRLTIRTDAVVGHTFELRFRDRLTAYLGRFLRRGKVVANDTLLDTIEPCVTAAEVEDFLRADIFAKGLVNGAETFVVVEVSSTGDTKDIIRAERRAAILRKAGLAAIPLVACAAILPESIDFAHRSGVQVWCNGSIVDAAA